MNLSWFFIIDVFILFELYNKYCKMGVLNASKDSSLVLEQPNQGHVECFVQLYCTYLINKFPRKKEKKKKQSAKRGSMIFLYSSRVRNGNQDRNLLWSRKWHVVYVTPVEFMTTVWVPLGNGWQKTGSCCRITVCFTRQKQENLAVGPFFFVVLSSGPHRRADMINVMTAIVVFISSWTDF